MFPKEAKENLRHLGCISENKVTGRFQIVSLPFQGSPRDLALFVRCLKVLGAYSVDTAASKRSVLVERGRTDDEMTFALDDSAK